MSKTELKEQRRANLAKVRTPESQRKRRLAQLEHEESLAQQMRDEGWKVFSPTVVCDRVGIKDGKVFFIEFKKPGQELRDGQRQIQELIPDNYLIKYSG
jgi:hypothetical protein